MASTITNQASLTYQYGTSTASALSNIASTLLLDALTVTKSSLTESYRPEDEITYIITVANTGAATLSDLVVTDDLGSYSIPGPLSVTPLDYVGPARLYVNGQYVSELTATTAAGSVSFTIPSLAAGANATILYLACVNAYAPQRSGDSITNTASFRADGLNEDASASYTINAEAYADLRLIKAMSPNPVQDGGLITYTFTLYNYGNTEATGVILTDAFSPAPSNLSVSVDGASVPASAYSYEGGLFTLPASGASESITVPAATYTQDASTGLISADPGVVSIVVTGTL